MTPMQASFGFRIRVGIFSFTCRLFIQGKGGSVEETPMFNSQHTAKFAFCFLCVYLFKNCPSQFLNHWESPEPVFCSEELSFLPYKNQKEVGKGQ